MPAIALGDLAALGGAWIAFEILFALTAVIGLVAGLVEVAPVFGPPIAGAMRNAEGWLSSRFHDWSDSVMGVLVQPVLWLWAVVGPTVDQIGGVFGGVYGWLHWMQYVFVPGLVLDAQQAVAGEVAGLENTVAHISSTAAADAQGALAAAEGEIGLALETAAHYAEGVGAQVLQTAEADIHGVEALAVAGVAQLTAVVAQNQAALESLVTGGLSQVQAGLGAAEAQAQREIADAVQGVRDWAKHNEKALSRALTGTIAGGLAGVISQVVTLEQELTRTKACADPLCNNLSGFGNSLSGLGSYLQTGAIFALVAFCVSDPRAAARAVNDVVAPMAAGLGDGLRAVTGL